MVWLGMDALELEKVVNVPTDNIQQLS